MADKTLSNDQKGNFDDLGKEAVDPSDIEDQQFIKKADGTDSSTPNPRFGLPRFLSWTLRKDSAGEDYWEAKGKDGKTYKVVSDEVKPPKKGKIVIT